MLECPGNYEGQKYSFISLFSLLISSYVTADKFFKAFSHKDKGDERENYRNKIWEAGKFSMP